MAAIIAFPLFRRQAKAPAVPAIAGSAKILFFTGVRIERHHDEPMPAPPVPKRPIVSPERASRQRRRN